MTRLRTIAVAVATLVLLFLGVVLSPPSVASARGHGQRLLVAPDDPAFGTYAWPVVGPVINGFQPPSGPYGPGHRGIDIAVPIGTPVGASAAGVVAFAGSVGGSLYVSIDHADGVRTTYSYLSSIAVRRGESVATGDVVGTTGHGHPTIPADHLHFGARYQGVYIDPLALLEPLPIATMIRLAPLPTGHAGALTRRPGWDVVPSRVGSPLE